MAKKVFKPLDFQEHLKEELKDPEFKRLYDEAGEQLAIAYRINHLRLQKKMSQAELAKKTGIAQSNIARLIRGNQNPTVQTLSRVARALNVKLEIALK